MLPSEQTTPLLDGQIMQFPPTLAIAYFPDKHASVGDALGDVLGIAVGLVGLGAAAHS